MVLLKLHNHITAGLCCMQMSSPVLDLYSWKDAVIIWAARRMKSAISSFNGVEVKPGTSGCWNTHCPVYKSPGISACHTFAALNNSVSQTSLPEVLSAANSIEGDSFSEMKVEHESVGRKPVFRGDVLNAGDIQEICTTFNHCKNETTVFFPKG